MRATAAAGFAHRHTVAYRLERIEELTGHDPRSSEGLEQLNLGLKARAVRDALQRTR
jgi:DNA-binding PucR family transcriptional regulator